ncbi:MAG: hypothetical protein AB8F65_03020 [Woeseiaceae bacterium]
MDNIAIAAFLALCSATISALVGFMLGQFGARNDQRNHKQAKLQNEPGEHYRRRIRRLSRYRSVCRAALLVGLSCALTGWLGAASLPTIQSAPAWIQSSVIILALIAIGWLTLRWWTLKRTIKDLRRQVEQRRQIADNLATVAGEQNRLYHDVMIDQDSPRIDHVLIGIRGAYAICTVANSKRKMGSAVVEGNKLKLDENSSVDLAVLRRRVTQLQHLLSKPLGKMIRLRPVVAVSGWSINGGEIDDMLLVGTRDLVMIQGWRDNNDQLLTEEATSLQADLATRACY